MCAKRNFDETSSQVKSSHFEVSWIPQESGQQIQEFKFHS
jgi:hypothetical protein